MMDALPTGGVDDRELLDAYSPHSMVWPPWLTAWRNQIRFSV